MTSFAADPATITDGDTVTLSWAAPCGSVTLAQKGKGPFQTLLPSTGTYVLRPGLDGYPTATGNTVYEARNADTATPREATVTVQAPLTAPTVSLSPVAGTTCHPKKSAAGAVTPCTVVFTASGRGYTSLAWSGCCAGSTGATANCSVNALKDLTCSVTATGPGGATSASAIATGVDVAPGVSGALVCNGVNPPTTVLPKNQTLDCSAAVVNPYDEKLWFSVVLSGACQNPCQNPTCDYYSPLLLFPVKTMSDPSNTCFIHVTVTDSWDKQTTQNWTVGVR